MPLTPAQRRLNDAYKAVFTGSDGQLVLDDLLVAARSFEATGDRRAGAMELVGHAISRLSLGRRAQLMEQDQKGDGRVRIENLEG